MHRHTEIKDIVSVWFFEFRSIIWMIKTQLTLFFVEDFGFYFIRSGTGFEFCCSFFPVLLFVFQVNLRIQNVNLLPSQPHLLRFVQSLNQLWKILKPLLSWSFYYFGAFGSLLEIISSLFPLFELSHKLITCLNIEDIFM